MGEYCQNHPGKLGIAVVKGIKEQSNTAKREMLVLVKSAVESFGAELYRPTNN